MGLEFPPLKMYRVYPVHIPPFFHIVIALRCCGESDKLQSLFQALVTREPCFLLWCTLSGRQVPSRELNTVCGFP